MDFFGVVSLVRNIEIRLPDTMTLFEMFLGMMYIVDWILGDLQASDDLLTGIDSDISIQKLFSCLNSSPRIVVAGEPGLSILFHLLTVVNITR